MVRTRILRRMWTVSREMSVWGSKFVCQRPPSVSAHLSPSKVMVSYNWHRWTTHSCSRFTVDFYCYGLEVRFTSQLCVTSNNKNGLKYVKLLYLIDMNEDYLTNVSTNAKVVSLVFILFSWHRIILIQKVCKIFSLLKSTVFQTNLCITLAWYSKFGISVSLQAHR